MVVSFRDLPRRPRGEVVYHECSLHANIPVTPEPPLYSGPLNSVLADLIKVPAPDSQLDHGSAARLMAGGHEHLCIPQPLIYTCVETSYTEEVSK